MNAGLARIIKEIQFNSPFRRYFFPRFPYGFTAPQLCFLCRCIEDSRHVVGAIAEIGCAGGYTTLFLNKYMDAQNIRKVYYAMDTFSGFVADDIEIEVTKRGKTKNLFTGFQANKKKWFDWAMQQNNMTQVQSIGADVNEYDLTTLGPLAFVLLDVDLYRPMKKCLREVYQVLSPGGTIVVDDCDPSNSQYDGADQAYKEFMGEMGQATECIYGKLGIVRKANL
jgi:predicted O-methyltransferase YrrM